MALGVVLYALSAIKIHTIDVYMILERLSIMGTICINRAILVQAGTKPTHLPI